VRQWLEAVNFIYSNKYFGAPNNSDHMGNSQRSFIWENEIHGKWWYYHRAIVTFNHSI